MRKEEPHKIWFNFQWTAASGRGGRERHEHQDTRSRRLLLFLWDFPNRYYTVTLCRTPQMAGWLTAPVTHRIPMELFYTEKFA